MHREIRLVGAYLKCIRSTTRTLLLDRSLKFSLYFVVFGIGMIIGFCYQIGEFVGLQNHPLLLYFVIATGIIYLTLTFSFTRILIAFIVGSYFPEIRLPARVTNGTNKRAINHIFPDYIRNEAKGRFASIVVMLININLLLLIISEKALLSHLEHTRMLIDRLLPHRLMSRPPSQGETDTL